MAALSSPACAGMSRSTFTGGQGFSQFPRVRRDEPGARPDVVRVFSRVCGDEPTVQLSPVLAFDFPSRARG